MIDLFQGYRWQRRNWRTSNISKSHFLTIQARVKYFGTVLLPIQGVKNNKRMCSTCSAWSWWWWWWCWILFYTQVGFKCITQINVFQLFSGFKYAWLLVTSLIKSLCWQLQAFVNSLQRSSSQDLATLGAEMWFTRSDLIAWYFITWRILTQTKKNSH